MATGILGGTGILPVILGRLASRPYSLSYHSALPSDPIRYGYKTFENCYKLICSLRTPDLGTPVSNPSSCSTLD